MIKVEELADGVRSSLRLWIEELEKNAYEEGESNGYDVGYARGYDRGVEYATEQVNDDKFALGFSKGYDVGYETAEEHVEEDKEIVEKRPKICDDTITATKITDFYPSSREEEEIAAVEKMSQSLREYEEGKHAETADHAQMQRDLAVQNAKDDIHDLSRFNNGLRYYVTSGEEGRGTFPEFIANADKRTVVVLMKGLATKEVHARGIAKAHPNDCFNVHIGKAIALRRALGIDVPDEYYNAPNPTEARVGDIARLNYDGDALLLSGRAEDMDNHGFGKAFWHPEGTWSGDDQFEVVDDTRDDVL